MNALKAKLQVWHPTKAFSCLPSCRFGLLILRGAPYCPCLQDTVQTLWRSALIKVAADGAGNLLHRMHSETFPMVPDAICGDLDSIANESLHFLSSKGAKVVKVEEQETTDFTKSVRLLVERASQLNLQLEMLIAVGGLCGRSDHMFGCVQSLFLHLDEHPELPIFLWHKESLVFLLPPGEHTIQFDKSLITGKCGLIPIGCTVKQVFTTGLRWELNGHSLAFGKLVSSSNEIVGNTVTVNTSDRLLFNLQLNTERLCRCT
uniref:Thiamine diphosphokinase n=1 Tax=Trichuris muris TaxID=70415 RepID=A0A5S6QN00_TRIMR